MAYYHRPRLLLVGASARELDRYTHPKSRQFQKILQVNQGVIRMNGWKILSTSGLVALSITVVTYTAYHYIEFQKPSHVTSPEPNRNSGRPILSEIAKKISTSPLFDSIVSETVSTVTATHSRININIPNNALFFDTDSYIVRRDISPDIRSIVNDLGPYSHLLVSGHAARETPNITMTSQRNGQKRSETCSFCPELLRAI